MGTPPSRSIYIYIYILDRECGIPKFHTINFVIHFIDGNISQWIFTSKKGITKVLFLSLMGTFEHKIPKKLRNKVIIPITDKTSMKNQFYSTSLKWITHLFPDRMRIIGILTKSSFPIEEAILMHSRCIDVASSSDSKGMKNFSHYQTLDLDCSLDLYCPLD